MQICGSEQHTFIISWLLWIRNLVYFSWVLCTESHRLKSRFQLTQSPLLDSVLPCTHGWGRPETLEAAQNSVYHIHLYLLWLVTSGIIFIISLLALHLLCLYYLFVTILTLNASEVAPVVKSPANAGDTRDSGSILGSGRAPGGGHGKPTSIFLPEESHEQKEEPGGLRSKGLKRVGHYWSNLAHTHWC